MKSGNPGLPWRGYISFLAFAGLFIFPCVVTAQQPPGTQPQDQTNAPAEFPRAKLRRSSKECVHRTSDSSENRRRDQRSVVDHEVGAGRLDRRQRVQRPGARQQGASQQCGRHLFLFDYVHVDGLSQEEAQALIQKRLEDGGFVRNPHVTIFVDDAASQGVTILGEVLKPGIYPDTASHKLYDVISQAGGFGSAASRKIAIIRRNQPDPIRVDLPRNLADDTSKNVDILPGTQLPFPRAPIVYVVGDVRPAEWVTGR